MLKKIGLLCQSLKCFFGGKEKFRTVVMTMFVLLSCVSVAVVKFGFAISSVMPAIVVLFLFLFSVAFMIVNRRVDIFAILGIAIMLLSSIVSYYNFVVFPTYSTLALCIVMLLLAVSIFHKNDDGFRRNILIFTSCLTGLQIVSKLFFFIQYYVGDERFSAKRNMYLLLITVLYCAAVMLFIFFSRTQFSFYKLFFFTVLVIGVFYATVLPPMSTPDEECHFATAYSYSNLILGGERKIECVGEMPNGNSVPFYKIPCRATDADVISKNYDFTYVWQYPSFTDYQNFFESAKEYAGFQDQFSSSFVGRITNASFIPYIPGIVGITLSRLIGLGGMQLMYVGRIFTLLFYSIVMSLAIKKIPFGKKLVAVIAAFPMSIHLAASFSYDVVLIAGTVYFVSHVLNLIYTKEKICVSDVVGISLAIVALSSTKMVYCVVVVLLFLIPKSKFEKQWQKPIFVASLILLAGLIIVVGSITALSSYMSPPATSEYYTFPYILTHIRQTLKLLATSIFYNGEMYFMTLVGNKLGWLELLVPSPIIVGFLVLLALALPKNREEKVPKLMHRIVFCIIVFAIISALFAATITWTSIGDSTIIGFQGRYLLEIAPLLMLAFVTTDNGLSYKKDSSKLFLVAMVPLHMFTILTMFNTIALR